MLIASLPSVVGLNTATVTSFFFIAFGTTRNVLSVGEQARPVSAWAMCGASHPETISQGLNLNQNHFPIRRQLPLARTHRPRRPGEHLPADGADGAGAQPAVQHAGGPAEPRGHRLGAYVLDRVRRTTHSFGLVWFALCIMYRRPVVSCAGIYIHTRPNIHNNDSIIFLLMSVFRLGSLIRFLSFSVMSDFTTYVPMSAETADSEPARHPTPSTHIYWYCSAAGLYVGLSQLKYILNVHPPQTHYHVEMFIWLGASRWFCRRGPIRSITSLPAPPTRLTNHQPHISHAPTYTRPTRAPAPWASPRWPSSCLPS